VIRCVPVLCALVGNKLLITSIYAIGMQLSSITSPHPFFRVQRSESNATCHAPFTHSLTLTLSLSNFESSNFSAST
jgi:hypothetical protein